MVQSFNNLNDEFICMVKCMLHMHVSDCDCPEFRDEIPFKEGRM